MKLKFILPLLLLGVLTGAAQAQGYIAYAYTPTAHGGTTFTLVQKVLGSACTATTATCSITVASTGSGNVGVLFADDFNGAALTISSISGGGTWSVPAGCSLRYSVVGNSNCAYNLNLTGAATTITVTWSSATTNSGLDHLVYYEYSWTGTTPTLDTTGTNHYTTAATTQAGVTLTLSGSSELLLQDIATDSASISSISSPYGNLESSGSILTGTADSENTSSGTAPTWTLASSSVAIVDAIAIK